MTAAGCDEFDRPQCQREPGESRQWPSHYLNDLQTDKGASEAWCARARGMTRDYGLQFVIPPNKRDSIQITDELPCHAILILRIIHADAPALLEHGTQSMIVRPAWMS